MITDIYKQNNPNPAQAAVETSTPPKKSNLKANSMFDENNKAIAQEEFNNRKRVKFTNDQQAISQANELIKKRKLPGDSNESKSKSGRSSQNKQEKLELTMFVIGPVWTYSKY